MYLIVSLLFLFEYWLLMSQDRDERFIILGLYLLAATFVGTIGVVVVLMLTAIVESTGRHWWANDGS